MMRSASPLLIGLSAVMVAIQDDMPLVLGIAIGVPLGAA